METYDSTEDTKKHIEKVGDLLGRFNDELFSRVVHHDESKLESPEKEMYDEYTPKLSATTYGSDEYKQCLKEMGVALKHHYENNSHHPEHYENGVDGMDLLDVIEMFCDWKAASLRHATGDFGKSLEYNKDRFHINPQLHSIFVNTAKNLGWIPQT